MLSINSIAAFAVAVVESIHSVEYIRMNLYYALGLPCA